MVSIVSGAILIFVILLLHSSNILCSSLHSLLIHRRQLLDGTAKSGGVAPKPPGSDSSINSHSSARSHLSTSISVNEKADERSVKETVQSKSSSKAGLIAAIAAPTGILGVIGAAVGAFFLKKNQSSSSTSNVGGMVSRFLGTSLNAATINKSGENQS